MNLHIVSHLSLLCLTSVFPQVCLSNVSVTQVFLWKSISFSHSCISGAIIWNKHFNLVLSRQKKIKSSVTTTVLHPLRSPALGNWPKSLLSFCCKSLSFCMLYSSSFLICKLQVSPCGTSGLADVERTLSPCKTLTASQLPELESWRGNDTCRRIVCLFWTRHGPALPLLLCFALNSPKYREN